MLICIFCCLQAINSYIDETARCHGFCSVGSEAQQRLQYRVGYTCDAVQAEMHLHAISVSLILHPEQFTDRVTLIVLVRVDIT